MGVVMGAFGLLVLVGTLLRQPWLVEGRKFKRLSEGAGPRVATGLYVVIGAVMLALGVLNVLGVSPWRAD